MNAWEAIQTSVDYIEKHLQEDISAERLANMVSLSPFYFQRLFKRLVNKPLQEYVKLRRMSKIIEKLKENEQRILDLALDYGFSSHANFSRAFKEVYGITPTECKSTAPLLNTFDKPDISMKYILVDEEVPLIINDIVLEVKRKKITQPEKYIGLVADVNINEQIPIGESTGIDVPGELWNKFHKEKDTLLEFINLNMEMGISYMSESASGTFKYFVGSFLEKEPKDLCNEYIIQELPLGEYIVCNIEAESFEKLVTDALNKANKYLFQTWLPNHQLMVEPFSAEKYYLNCDCINRMEIWLKLMNKGY
ncbi:AraC family transcriptional regulator [Clostridium sp.]|uniref:AraC family transcriptional regulator n=1 Tax=Clostridium sp. TaxID=1506 RepID=UPI0025C2F520|nr:AraC family transcriptional regulator [Clostridium sp.]